ncbi:tetratricopeptide repeat protein [Psychrosphaera sp. B3R10]|uniref:tetratricopeptide repeat protein n=1 Tax=unclassified Psychrosphaera TaxID=2641570 RepID=UPI001C0A3218|nr:MULTISPECIES: tetratricopeptide repeat protein [unclassified Psychrosphaera]MBU2882752.1 tetratricopeptide repeat protein [Psychrosphaera sp. I2R16]MBU2989230.1 tetratricopeptide repeat protein [Psychrosphaera sp. B3R10]
MYKYLGLHQLIFLVLFVATLPVKANDSKRTVCDKNLALCIDDLTQRIEKTPVASHLWFHRKLNLLDLLFQAQDYPAVLKETNALLSLPSLPHRVEINSLMYKVKMGKLNGDEDLTPYIKRVDDAFSNLTSSAPQSIIDYATFQIYTGDYTKGRSLLLELERKFLSHNNYYIKKQIYTILGHLSHRLNDRDATLNYVSLAYDFAHKDVGIHYQLMTSYNVARALHFQGRFDEAKIRLREVIEQASLIKEISYQSLSYLRLAEIANEVNDVEGLRESLNRIETKRFMAHDIELFHKLQKRL